MMMRHEQWALVSKIVFRAVLGCVSGVTVDVLHLGHGHVLAVLGSFVAGPDMD